VKVILIYSCFATNVTKRPRKHFSSRHYWPQLLSTKNTALSILRPYTNLFEMHDKCTCIHETQQKSQPSLILRLDKIVCVLEMSTPHILIGIINVASPSTWWANYTLPTPAGASHRRMESTSTSCNQWLSLTKIARKVPPAGRNGSLVASTNECGEDISGVFFFWGGGE